MNPQPKTKRFVPVMIGVVLSFFLIAGGYFIFQAAASRAEDTAPRDVVVSGISENSAKVSWSTGQESQGVIEYGISPASLTFIAPEGEKSLSHSLDLTLLSPATTYYFQIRIADSKYDNGGVPWTFTTKSAGTADIPDTGSENDEFRSADFTTSPTCNETDCEAIKAKFFSGCDTQDYIKCLKAKEAAE